MKKIAIILSVIFAVGLVSSCVQPFEYTIPLSVNNVDLTLPRAGDDDSDNTNYLQITSTGVWEATLVPGVAGETWCWFLDHYLDANGKEVKVVESIGYYEDTDIVCKVRGKGTVWVPIKYQNTSVVRYATLTVRRVDTDDVRIVHITQK